MAKQKLIDISTLFNVATYAKNVGKSPTWIYKLSKDNVLKSVVIDKTKFIVDDSSSKSIFVDVSVLKNTSTYAKLKKCTIATVNNHIRAGLVDTVTIDKTVFIVA